MCDKIYFKISPVAFWIFFILQICSAIIIPNQEQPRPAYTSGIKTATRKNGNPYTLQNYSKVIVDHRPDATGAQYFVTKTQDIQNVYPVYNSHTYGQRPRTYQNILQTQSHTQINAGECSKPNRTIIKRKIESKTLEVYSKCPTGATGQFIYLASCNQFLNCWKGRGSVQNCAPGTLFNPRSLECDFPDKVECLTGPWSNTLENRRVEKSIQQAGCPKGFSGIIPDYFDCSKFINCNNGQPNKMDCPPGTLFDMNKNICDYPHQTTCFNGEHYSNVKTNPVQWEYEGNDQLTNGERGHTSCSQNQNCRKGYVGQPTIQIHTYCNPQTQNCGQNYGQHTSLGQNYQPGQSGGQTSNSQTVGQNCNPATDNCGQYSGQSPNYGQHSNYGHTYQSSSSNGNYGQNVGQSVGQTYSSQTTDQKCNPTTHNCGQYSGQRKNYGQNAGQSGGQTLNAQTIGQRCNSATHNCGQNGGQTTNYGQGASQGQNGNYGQSNNEYLGIGQGELRRNNCNPAVQNCGQYNRQGTKTYTQSNRNNVGSSSNNGYSSGQFGNCNPLKQNCNNAQGNYQNTVSNQHTTGSQFNCDLSKPNCGRGQENQRPNYGTVCNVNDYNCRQNQETVKTPKVNNLEPVCQSGAVGLHKHPSDCKKYLNCANGLTYVMDCAPGTMFNAQSGICDFPHNVHCEVADVIETTSDRNAGGSWHTQYEVNSQDFANNAGHGNVRYTTETYANQNNNWDQQTINQNTLTETNRGQSGYVTRPDIGQKSSDYEDVYNPSNQRFSSSTPRSAVRSPYETNDIGDIDYIFTYDNGDPVILEPENIIDATDKTTKVCENDDFHCTSKSCIPFTMVCDGRTDCNDGKDELNCEEFTERFTPIKNSRLIVVENQRVRNVSQSTCAVLCIQNKKFNCRSFTYRKLEKTCLLSDKNIGLTGALQHHQSCDYYELKTGTIDCSDRSKYFECHNKKCLTNEFLCDGYNDCEDREDEKYCGAEKFGYKIKLAGSKEKNEGRVEVTAFGSSGYICDDDFSIVDANVVCRELGFELGAAGVNGQSQFAKDLNESSTLYMIDDLNCIGNESSLIDCSFPGWGIHNCRDQEIAGVVCKTPQENCGPNDWKCDTGNECIPFDFVCDGVEDCTDDSDEAIQHCEAPTELRLVSGSYPGEGRVEIKHNGIWGTICDDDFNEDAAKVVCKFLRYKGKSYVKKDAFFGAGSGPIWLDQVSCFGNETEINKCTHWNWGEHNCEHSEDVGVICSQDIEEVKIERHSNLPIRIEEGLPENCGFRKDNQFAIHDLIQARVIGGGVAKKGDYPWQAALKVRVKDKSAHWCGAVIISSKWVLTAAHCLQGYTKGAYIIVAGEYNTDEDEGTEQQKFIDEFFIHERFRKGHKLNNDIALIKVKGTGFELNDDVQPICLPDADTKYNRQLNCTISGFGSVKSGVSAYSHNLLAAWIPIHSQEICQMPHVYGDALTDGMICAGSMEGGLDACDGDSGGPLACLDQGVFTLYGITSWGQHCGYANKPGVYVKVGHYRKWIEDIISKHSG